MAGHRYRFFLASRVRKIADYTLPDLLERRYGPAARVLGTIAVIIAYTTIAGYQFKGLGFLLHVILPQQISMPIGISIAAIFCILFTASGGMLNLVTLDIFNGAAILLGIFIALPFLFFGIGGFSGLHANLPADHFTLFGPHNWVWAMGVFFPTFLLLLGESNMYQKFFSAKNEQAARQAVAWWILGTIVIEVAICTIAVIGSAHFKNLAEPELIFLLVAREGMPLGLPVWAGCLLLCSAVAIIISTANGFLLTPATNITRDLYQRFFNPQASQRSILLVNRLSIVGLGILAYLTLTRFPSVLAMAFTASTMIGAGLTPVILAAFLWKRVTAKAGISSIAGGMLTVLLITLLNNYWRAHYGHSFLEEDYIVLPSAAVSLFLLIVVSLLTPPDPESRWKIFFNLPSPSGTSPSGTEEEGKRG